MFTLEAKAWKQWENTDKGEKFSSDEEELNSVIKRR